MSKLLFVLGTALLLLFVACSDDGEIPVPAGGQAQGEASPGAEEKKTTPFKLPSQLLGLRVVTEDVSIDVARVKQVYFDSIGLFSFRDKELLRATLQVSKFNEGARPDSPGFRSRILAGLGSTVSQELRIGDQRVYLTSGNQQTIFVWFQKGGFFALSVRADYPFGRTLLRRMIEADLKL